MSMSLGPMLVLASPWLLSAAFGRMAREWTTWRRIACRGAVAIAATALGTLLFARADAVGGAEARALYVWVSVSWFAIAPAAAAGVAWDGWHAVPPSPLVRAIAVVAGLAVLVFAGLFAMAFAIAGALGGGGMIG